MSTDANQVFPFVQLKAIKYLKTDTLCISPKTFKYFSCSRKDHIINKLIIIDSSRNNDYFVNELNVYEKDTYIKKIIFENKSYLYFFKSNRLYLTNDDINYEQTENKSFSIFKNKNIRYLIILDDKNIVANIGKEIISFFEYKDLKYEKFFNNINKYYTIIGLLKLDNSKFCFLSIFELNKLKLLTFKEDFTSEEITLKYIKCNEHTINNIIFKINKDYIVIVGFSEFIIFSLKYNEIVTVVETDIIISVLNITLNNPELEEYEYMALITMREDKFYFQIYQFKNPIQKSKIINLNELSIDFQIFMVDKTDEIKYINNDDPFGINPLTFNLFEDTIAFDMNYDLKNNENIVIMMGINSFKTKKRLLMLLDVNLKNFHFK